MKDAPEFVVLAIKRGCVTDYLLELFEKGIPVLTETPPGESQEDLQKLWSAYEKYQPKIQVAEQYFLQPLYASWHKAIAAGTDRKCGEYQYFRTSRLPRNQHDPLDAGYKR